MSRSTHRSEWLGMVKLATPVVLGELGWMMMSTVDLIMTGQLGDAALGGIGVGNNLFYTFAVTSIGLLFGLDTLVSQAYGAGDLRDCRHSLTQGLWLATAVGIPLTALFWLLHPAFAWLGVTQGASRYASSYLEVLSFSSLPLLVYAALRRYLQGLHQMRPVMFALVSANLVNWFLNWLLIAGHAGFPSLGVRGSALSTVIARLYMCAVLGLAVVRVNKTHRLTGPHHSLEPDLTRMRRLLSLGLPSAGQILVEMGAFGSVGVLAGTLNETALAAHQIALNWAAFTFMVPLGISSATAVAVGRAIGSGDPNRARRAGFNGLTLACSFMLTAGIFLMSPPHGLLALYTRDRATIALSGMLLSIAAAFQLFDGAQVVLTGALRGLGDTRSPMLINAGGYWCLGIPLGYLLCFRLGFGVQGLWWGLTVSLMIISLALLLIWLHRSSRKQALAPAA